VKRYVLDASALLAFFQDEPGAEKVQELLTRAGQAERPLLMSVVNWGEVIYVVWQRRGEEAARERMRAMARYPLEIVGADAETTLLAATLKARHKLPYVDCFAAACEYLFSDRGVRRESLSWNHGWGVPLNG